MTAATRMTIGTLQRSDTYSRSSYSYKEHADMERRDRSQPVTWTVRRGRRRDATSNRKKARCSLGSDD